MKVRNCGIDIFRILCCIGVLNYHIMDDVINIEGGVAKFLYFGGAFCIPGFFMLSGYLIEEKRILSIEYCESKIKNILCKLFGWIIFWTVIHFLWTGEIYDLWDQLVAGIASDGILPVSWFLFTYCLLLIIAYPLHYLSKNYEYIFMMICLAWVVALAVGFGKSIILERTQSLWLHLYLGYFILGMALNKVLKWIKLKTVKSIRVICEVVICVLAFVFYTYKVEIAEIYMPPHGYYGKWYYTIWLITLFMVSIEVSFVNSKIQAVIKQMAANTFVVYLGHLPILIYITRFYSLTRTWMAVIFIVLFFIGLELVANFFRRIPLLRNLV